MYFATQPQHKCNSIEFKVFLAKFKVFLFLHSSPRLRCRHFICNCSGLPFPALFSSFIRRPRVQKAGLNCQLFCVWRSSTSCQVHVKVRGFCSATFFGHFHEVPTSFSGLTFRMRRTGSWRKEKARNERAGIPQPCFEIQQTEQLFWQFFETSLLCKQIRLLTTKFRNQHKNTL